MPRKQVTCRYESSKGREGYRIKFYDATGKRRAIWLGNRDQLTAETWRGHVEHLAQSAIDQSAPSAQSTKWLNALLNSEREKLARVGLVASLPTKPKTVATKSEIPLTLKAFINHYIDCRNVKDATQTKWEQVRDALVKYFGADRSIESINAADAEVWRDKIAREGNIREGKERKNKDGKTVRGRISLSDNTVRRRTGIAKQFFAYALKAKLITDNPFVGLKTTVHGNEARQFFVDMETFNHVIEHAPGTEWEAILALSRLAGMRCPSEVMRLKWQDIDFGNGHIRIHASKTEHHSNGGIRLCPLFPSLRPYLERLAELAKSRDAKPSDYVVANHRGSESVLRTGLLRILKRAGIEPWPKLFQNMRASRETELIDLHPIKDVCSWLGNTQAVAMKHYAMQRQDSFRIAAGLPIGGPVGGPEHRQLSAESGINQGPVAAANQRKRPLIPLFAGESVAFTVGEEGLEPPTSTL